ncbi:MAG: MFS transporter [Dehalococcoidales bacterium]|nr:MFS transporter [Dehalococcoidales bacterium]
MEKSGNNTIDRIKTSTRELFSGLVPLFILAHFMHHVPGFIIQSVQPSIRDHFGLDYLKIGALNGVYNASYGASNLLAGWLGGDHIAPRLLIAVGVAGVAIFGLFVGLSPTYLMMLVALIIMGILGGGYHPSASPLLSDTVAVEKRGQVLGMHQIGGTLANFLTPLLTTTIATFLTWRGPFIVLAIPTIAFGIYLYALLKRRQLGGTLKQVQTDSFAIRINQRGYVRRMIAFVTLGTAVQVFVFSSISFIPLLVVDQYGGLEQAGAAFLALAHFAGLWAGPIGGYISDRYGKVPVMLTVSLAAGPIIFLLSLGTYWWLLPFVLLAMGTCMYVAMPVSEVYVISNAKANNRSTILGIYYFASRGGPGILMPIIGKLIDQFSFSVAFAWVGAALFVIALVCSLLLWGTRD